MRIALLLFAAVNFTAAGASMPLVRSRSASEAENEYAD